MLSAGFCHLLAEALPIIHEKVPKFPLGTFLCASGYVLTLVADEIAVAFTGHTHSAPMPEKGVSIRQLCACSLLMLCLLSRCSGLSLILVVLLLLVSLA